MDTQRSGTRFLFAFNAAMNRVVFWIAGFGDILLEKWFPLRGELQLLFRPC